MEKTPAMYAQEYLASKKNLLSQCVQLTIQVGHKLGNIPETHQLLGNRKQLLSKLAQLDQDYAQILADYPFTEEDLAPIAQLAEQMWNIDDRITEAMRSNKNDLQDFLNDINTEVLKQMNQA